jgi:UDP-glucose 4-epimerase
VLYYLVMNILVTGGAGFIGSHLVESLLTEGNQVIVLDDLSAGNKENLTLRGNPGDLRIVEGSILDKNLVSSLLESVDKCFHLAASLGVANIVNDPITALEVNITGSQIVLNEAANRSIRTVMTSTSEIYGRNSQTPLDENSDRILGSPKISRWTYSEAKALDEFMAFHLNKSRNFPVTIARLFNTVGPRQVGKYGMVLPRFIESALKNEPLTVYGDGSQTRTFCSVGEVVNALNSLSKSDQTIGEVYNVGSVNEISIIDLAKKVISKVNSSSEILFKSFSENFGEEFEEASSRVPSIAKIQSAISWQSTKGIDEIIDDIVLFKSI